MRSSSFWFVPPIAVDTVKPADPRFTQSPLAFIDTELVAYSAAIQPCAVRASTANSKSVFTMNRAILVTLSTCSLAVLLTLPSVALSQGQSTSADEQAIQASATAYQSAFNQGDSQKLANLWMEDGELIDQTGHLLKGRKALADAFKKFFEEHKGATIKITVQSIEFPHPNTAVEIGTTQSQSPGADASIGGHYSAIHIKKDGQWFLQRVNEGPELPPSNYEHLKELEWLIGSWVDDTNGHDQAGAEKTPVVHTTCRWSVNRNFLIRNFTATLNGQVTATGVQHIGWYAPTQQIRSWTFDSRGHIIASMWQKSGDSWKIVTKEALQDGEIVRGDEILTRKDNNTQVWTVNLQTADGKSQKTDVVVRRVQPEHLSHKTK